jgi:hypothetical protein
LLSGGQVRSLLYYPFVTSVIVKNAKLEEDARAALSAAAQGQAQAHNHSTAKPDEATDATAFVDTATFADASLAPESSKSTVAKVKKKGKPKLTPKEKKERSVREIFLLFFSSFQ